MTMYQQPITLTLEEMGMISGGHQLEEKFADAALYRAGITFIDCIFGSDEFWIGSTRISKSLAKSLRERSTNLWKAKYSESGDLVAYIREWKEILGSEYGIAWNGVLGKHDWSWT